MDSRATVQRIATHVLARRRYAVAGRFGLRVTPGGLGTPAFGDDVETIRIAGTHLVRETTGGASYRAIDGASLRELAMFAGADLDAEFSVGADTPPVGDPDAPVSFDHASVEVAMAWLAFGWQVLDIVLAAQPRLAEPAALQLWPEHFDIGTNVGVGGERRTNLGVSLGDAEGDEPYLYVGPWDDRRPGDPAYWNVPFGARARRSQIEAAGDASAAAVTFLTTGLELLRAGA